MREAMVIPETKNIADLFRMMQKTKTQMVIVVDEYGQTKRGSGSHGRYPGRDRGQYSWMNMTRMNSILKKPAIRMNMLLME